MHAKLAISLNNDVRSKKEANRLTVKKYIWAQDLKKHFTNSRTAYHKTIIKMISSPHVMKGKECA